MGEEWSDEIDSFVAILITKDLDLLFKKEVTLEHDWLHGPLLFKLLGVLAGPWESRAVLGGDVLASLSEHRHPTIGELMIETYLLLDSLSLSSLLLFWKSAALLEKTNTGSVKAEKMNFFEYIFIIN
jgi:hypothetical protein